MAVFTWAEYETNVPEGHSPRVRCYYCYRGLALENSSEQEKEVQEEEIERNGSNFPSEPIDMGEEDIKIENESKAGSPLLMDRFEMEMEDVQSPSSNLEARSLEEMGSSVHPS